MESMTYIFSEDENCTLHVMLQLPNLRVLLVGVHFAIPDIIPCGSKIHGTYMHVHVSVQCTCSNIEATALHGCFVTMFSFCRRCKNTFLNTAVFEAFFSQITCGGSGRAIARRLTTGGRAPSDALSGAPSGAPSVTPSNETLAKTAFCEFSNDARFRYYGHTCRTPSRAPLFHPHQPMWLIIGWRQHNCEPVIHMARFVVSQKVGRLHSKETPHISMASFDFWQRVPIQPPTEVLSHHRPHFPSRIFRATGTHKNTHILLIWTRLVATRVLHGSRVLRSQTATENRTWRKKTQNCKLASWVNEDIKVTWPWTSQN